MQRTQWLDEPRTAAGQNALPLVQVQSLKKHYTLKKSLFGRGQSFVYAVDDVSFALYPGESFGLVGESGSGKTTIGKLLTRLLDPTAGQILLHDGREHYTDIAKFRGKSLKSFRRRAQMIFQDPYESMNPRRTIFDTVGEPLAVQHMGGRLQRLDAVTHMLNAVGLTPASSFLFRYPHELSGGQRQRVAIARALVLNPHLVVADEPTSMLDVSVRTGVMKLMQGLATLMNITYLYITHDLAVARYMCDQIAVMYMGKIVEMAETEELLKNPLHPYTRALLSAVPVPDPTHKRPPVDIGEDAPNPVDPPPRCSFYDRCPVAIPFCKEAPAPALEAQGSGHYAACYRI